MDQFGLGERSSEHVEVADIEDLERLAELSRTLVGFLDPGALAQRLAVDLYRLLGLPLVSVAVREGPSSCAMRGVCGAQTDQFGRLRPSTGEGLGGRVMVERRPIDVQNYVDDPGITKHFVDVVSAESIGGIVAVPIEHDDELVGLLYGGLRSIGSIGDRAKIVLESAAESVAPMMAASIRASDAIRQHVNAERWRIAGELHDDVGQLLFSIGVAAQRLRDGGDENLSALAERIESQASEAAQRMRQAFKMMGPVSSSESVAVALQREIEDLGFRSNLVAHLVVRGTARPLPARAEAALIGAARQALVNIEQHASASLVVATLHFTDSEVSLVIQDDGCGIPEDFELPVIPQGDHHWGLASILRQTQQQGGRLNVCAGEDGGTTVRIALPIEVAP
ncbi:histidine kinase [Candidatus Poriferisodalis sp.]|uniref:GAF domain-containing sensor histidine kinase n=1 Tax=Candidatus Poriferisodalis sp. TaxID=3101277 RepID=UPI003B5C7221